MKRMLIWMLLNVSFISINAQNVAWAKKGGLWAYDDGYGIANDNYGNVYVAGKYEMNAKFSGITLPCEGNHDSFVAKYNSSGNLEWIRTSGGYTGDYATCVATDGNYVYVAGEIEGNNATIKFPGSPITLKCKASNDVFLAKYTVSGTLLWARSAGGYDYEKALGITFDNAGNVLICGAFRGASTFGYKTIYGSGENDIFVAKYDANGNFLWVKQAGSSKRDEAKSIKCDAYGNVYIAGTYKDGCNFNGQWLYSPSSYFNMFIAKYSPSGNFQWVKTGGGTYDDVAWGIDLDNNGKIYVTGEFNATANFGGQTIWTTGSADIFVACYDMNGNIQWIRKAGGSGVDRARGIGVAGNKIYITGQYAGTAYFGPHTRYAADNSDIFIACLDNYGTFKWVTAAGGAADAPEDLGFESGTAVCAQTNGNVHGTGAMLNGAVWGGSSLSAYTRSDVFVVKITSPPSGRSEENMLANEEEDEAVDELPGKLGGTEDLQGYISGLNIYPNPGDGYFVLEFNSKESAQYDIIIFNSLGQIIEQKQITVPTITNLDLAGREKGIYFVELRNAEAMHRKKVVLR